MSRGQAGAADRPTAGAARPAAFEVLAPGLLTTVQDAGRPGLEALGVPGGGAADPLSLAAANLLVGNEAGAAAIEATLLGPELRVERDITIGLAGADLGVHVLPGGRRLAPGASYGLRVGEVLAFESVEPDLGCRAYLALPGGVDVPEVLGSRSTSLVGAFGGLDGRALRAGDALAARMATGGAEGVRWPADLSLPWPDGPIGVLVGPAAEDQDPSRGPEAFAALITGAWTVSHDSDRRGLRLDGPSLPVDGSRAESPSRGVLPGAIQLTPGGQPIVLMPDAGTTGGYPVIGVVCAADLWRLGQLRPGSPVRFEHVDLEAARAALADRRRLLAAATERLGPRLS